MPARDASHTFVIPSRFDPRWSLLGRALRHFTGDRLRAGALQIVFLTGVALAWLMGVYATEAAAAFFAPAPLTLGIGLAAGALGVIFVGIVGVRPQAVVTGGPEALTVERGRERLRLPYASLAEVEVVEARLFHRHYRRYAAARPFLGTATAPVLLLHAEGDETIAALGLRAEERDVLRRHVEERRERQRKENGERQPAGISMAGKSAAAHG